MGDLFGALTSAFLGVKYSGSSTDPSAPNYENSFDQMNSAKGNVFRGSGLSTWRNKLVERPTFFRFAKGGLGVMGEAGTEGIFPLARDSQGNLGVRRVGGGGGVPPAAPQLGPIYVSQSIDSRSDAAQIAQMMQASTENAVRFVFEELRARGVTP